MKRRYILIFAALACLTLPPILPGIWKNRISLPVLGMLSALGSRIPFSLLEWLAAAWSGWLVFGFFRMQQKRTPGAALLVSAKRILCTLLTLLLLFCALWLPLYEKTPVCFAASARLQSCAEALIAQINRNPPDFSETPDDLPAKYAAFPFWMRALNISGFYSFFTGEALISPDLSPAALPFVAVHESVHGRGIAGEGLCNILAYEECIGRGGVYAQSAKLWALHYLLAELRNTDYGAFVRCLEQMNVQTLQLVQSIGGIPEMRPADSARQAFSARTGGYEILAHYLAMAMPG